MGSFRDELKYVLRRLGRAPMFTAVTLLTLAVGIGANSAIFSVVRGVLLKPLPYPKPDELVSVGETAQGLGMKDVPAAPATYFTFRDHNRTLQDIGLWNDGEVSVTGLAEPEWVKALFVTDGIFPVLGTQPILGRRFTRKDASPGSPETVMLTYGYWRRRFGGDPSVIGRRLVVDGRANEIIGVLPERFRFMNVEPAIVRSYQFDRNKEWLGHFSYQSIARLKPGVSIAQANADEARMLPIMFRSFPVPPGLSMAMIKSAHMGPNVRPLINDVVGDVGSVLWVLMGVVGIVLFIACANVANLLLVRAEGRQQELAIRSSLGADWVRIARELLLESVMLALMGGVLGLGLAYGVVRLLVAMGPANLPRLNELSIDGPVLLFTFAVALIAGILFGLVPVFKYASGHVGAALREGGRTLSAGRERHRARSVLVVVQVALALVLLISSGLMIRTFQALRSVQPGFTNPNQILTFGVSIPETVANPEQVARMDNEIVEKVAAIPGVTSTGLSDSLPMDGSGDHDPAFVEDRPVGEGKLPMLRTFKFIGPGYFKAMGNLVLAGRDLTWADIFQMRPVVLVSESFAREFWDSPAAALGKRVRESEKSPWREIVGVAGDEYDDGVDKKPPQIVYWPMVRKNFWGDPVEISRSITFVVRSTRSEFGRFSR